MKLRFATSNQGKLREARAKLRPVRIVQLDLSYPEIQASSLEEVVEHALIWIEERGETNVMIEDSGLFIDALDGFPGPYSAQVYNSIGCRGVLKLLEDTENRGARFQACVGLLLQGKSMMFKGTCRGTISHEPKGRGGFGFDPIFRPRGHNRTFAEMGMAAKNELSHRAMALDRVSRFLSNAKETWLD